MFLLVRGGGRLNVSQCLACSFCWLERVIYPCSVSFCAEHARRNTLALQAQMKKSNPGPASETLLCQLSSYAKSELGSQAAESSRSEASRILGKHRKKKAKTTTRCSPCRGEVRVGLGKASEEKIHGDRTVFCSPCCVLVQGNHTTSPKNCRFPCRNPSSLPSALLGAWQTPVLSSPTCGVARWAPPWPLAGWVQSKQPPVGAFLLIPRPCWGGKASFWHETEQIHLLGGCGAVPRLSVPLVPQMRTAGATASRILSPWSRRGEGTRTARLTASIATRRIP